MGALRRRACWLWLVGLSLPPAHAFAQSEPKCVVFCAPDLKVEPTWTIENLRSRPRIETGGQVERASRERKAG